jgi:DNA-directed RNA polymerase subunit RPC12/RpoP
MWSTTLGQQLITSATFSMNYTETLNKCVKCGQNYKKEPINCSICGTEMFVKHKNHVVINDTYTNNFNSSIINEPRTEKDSV